MAQPLHNRKEEEDGKYRDSAVVLPFLTVIKLNLLFVLFSLAGGIIFGVGPALQMMTDFILEEGMNYQAITVKRAFESWKAHFKRSNCYFLLFSSL